IGGTVGGSTRGHVGVPGIPKRGITELFGFPRLGHEVTLALADLESQFAVTTLLLGRSSGGGVDRRDGEAFLGRSWGSWGPAGALGHKPDGAFVLNTDSGDHLPVGVGELLLELQAGDFGLEPGVVLLELSGVNCHLGRDCSSKWRRKPTSN